VRTNGDGKPVVAIDIDGTLADYHGHFLNFARGWLGREVPDPDEINDGKPLHQFMGITKATYREVKLAYRQGGLKRSMPCIEGADMLVNRIRRQACLRNKVNPGSCYQHGLGAEVWICTTRPYLRLDNIDPDTREWLRRFRIRYDALLFDPSDGDNKYRELARQAGDRVAIALEDLPAQALKAHQHKVPIVALHNQPYNQYWDDIEYPWLYRWSNTGSAYELVCAALKKWRRQHAD
jgi:hypothetical protein